MRVFLYPWGIGIAKRGEIHWRALLFPGGFYWRRRGVFWKLKAPWEFAMFSERYGHTPTVWRFLGWRLLRDTGCPDDEVKDADHGHK
jgi:hypothetical protein